MVHIQLLDPTGSELLSFDANGEQTLIEQMEERAFDMPYSCRAGSCMTCCLIVQQGKDCIDETLGGDKFIDTDDDQILSCIAGISQEKIDSPEQHSVILQMIDLF